MTICQLLSILCMFLAAFLVWALFKVEDLNEQLDALNRRGVFILPPDPPTDGQKGGRSGA